MLTVGMHTMQQRSRPEVIRKEEQFLVTGNKDSSAGRGRLLQVPDDSAIGFADIGQHDFARMEFEIGPVMGPQSNGMAEVSHENDPPGDKQSAAAKRSQPIRPQTGTVGIQLGTGSRDGDQALPQIAAECPPARKIPADSTDRDQKQQSSNAVEPDEKVSLANRFESLKRTISRSVKRPLLDNFDGDDPDKSRDEQGNDQGRPDGDPGPRTGPDR